ncbi:MAG: type I glyceraldehyde-3-phosphate dehydrogenase [Clostridia bacterium]
MTVKVGINGFGRIGRQVYRIAHKYPEVEIVAINDLMTSDQMAFLLKHDSNFGEFIADVSVEDDYLVVDDKKTLLLTERDPKQLPWGDLNVDVVIEATGIFREREKAAMHLGAGAKKVVISAPGKNSDYTVVLGVNEEGYDPESHHIISNASCTTNCLAPVCKVLEDNFGIEKGLMTTIHSYTNGQNILDGPNKDYRRARAAALSMIPTTTGAAKAIGEVMPELDGKLDGMAVRVPTPTGSLVDLIVELKKETTVEEINQAFEEAANGKMEGILGVSYEPLVSVDYIGDSRSSIVDALSTKMMGSTMVKILSWYDNEWGYSSRVVDLVAYIGNKGV